MGCEASKPNIEESRLDYSKKGLNDDALKDKDFLNKLKNTKAAYLDLSQNDIGDQGMKNLCKCLERNKYVSTLDISQNQIGDEGIIALSNLLRVSKTLIVVDLVRNKCTDRGALALAETLKKNSTLAEIYLEFNQISEHGAAAIANSVKMNKRSSITKLDQRIQDMINRINGGGGGGGGGMGDDKGPRQDEGNEHEQVGEGEKAELDKQRI